MYELTSGKQIEFQSSVEFCRISKWFSFCFSINAHKKYSYTIKKSTPSIGFVLLSLTQSRNDIAVALNFAFKTVIRQPKDFFYSLSLCECVLSRLLDNFIHIHCCGHKQRNTQTLLREEKNIPYAIINRSIGYKNNRTLYTIFCMYYTVYKHINIFRDRNVTCGRPNRTIKAIEQNLNLNLSE